MRSGCPINLSMELLGDRWTLLVLRDIVFVGARRFRELLAESLEGISSNVLADRLEALVEHGMLTRSSDPGHKQKVIYSLTEQAIELVPILIELGDWGFDTSRPARSTPPETPSSPPAARRCGRPSWTSCARPTSARTPDDNRPHPVPPSGNGLTPPTPPRSQPPKADTDPGADAAVVSRRAGHTPTRPCSVPHSNSSRAAPR